MKTINNTFYCAICQATWIHRIKYRNDLRRYSRRNVKKGEVQLQFYVPKPTKLGVAMCPECAFFNEEHSPLPPLYYQAFRQREKMHSEG